VFPKVSGFKKYLWRWIDARGPRTRFAVYRLVIMTGRPFDAGILQRLAAELEREGSLGLAVQCWGLVHRVAPYDSDGLVDHLPAAVESGEMARVRWFAEQARREVGFPPGHAVWLTGMLACRGHYAEAGKMLASFAGSPGEVRRVVSQFPSIILDRTPKDWARLSDELCRLQSGREEAAGNAHLKLARLCFTFRRMELAAQLYRAASNGLDLSVLDSVAMLYACARTDPGIAAAALGDGDLALLIERVSTDSDALIMLANVDLATGGGELAAVAVERAVRWKYGDLDRFQPLLDDCLAILGVVGMLRDRPSVLPPELLEESGQDTREGVPKVFVCGFGWSGSGAVYDDIRGAEGFSEFEGAGDAPLLNADSGTEVTFIQSDAGLGDTWMVAKTTGTLVWQRFWDLFCLHVAGLSGIGYNDYKSCAAAANNVRRHGSLYTRPFRRFLEEYSALLEMPVRGGLIDLLGDTTEALCRMLLEQEGGRAVLFNNAVFGREAEMLRIFRASRAAVVFRDPLDVYADRKNQDKNHWRTPRQLAELYGRGLRKYIAYRTGEKGRDLQNVREVPFERFILDPSYRAQVRGWLLSGVVEDAGTSYLDPAVSSRNIGLHRVLLDARGREEMRSMTDSYRQMQQLVDQAWSADPRCDVGADGVLPV